jgi:hypothetical protein
VISVANIAAPFCEQTMGLVHCYDSLQGVDSHLLQKSNMQKYHPGGRYCYRRRQPEFVVTRRQAGDQ